MTVLAFAFALVALVLFAVAAFGASARVNLVALGLAVLTFAWIAQLAIGGTLVHL
jgi:hypothetical protein